MKLAAIFILLWYSFQLFPQQKKDSISIYNLTIPLTANYSALHSQGKWFLGNNTSSEIIPSEYDVIGNYEEGVISVSKNDLWGCIDTLGKEIVACRYELPLSFTGNTAIAYKDGYFGLINKNGKELCPFVYDYIDYSFSEGLVSVRQNDKYGFIDSSGNETIRPQYSAVGAFHDGLAMVKQENKWGYINKDGILVIPMIYENAQNFNEDFAAVSLVGKWGYIDKKGNTVIPFKYDDTIGLAEDLAGVYLDGKAGFIDITNTVVLPFKYEYIESFREGIARVRIMHHDRLIYIDKNGKEYTTRENARKAALR